MKTAVALFILSFVIISNSFSQNSNFEEGLKAFDAKDFNKAFNLLKPYADNGNCTAQFVIGYAYQFGLSVEQNDTLAINWLKKSAEQKQPAAMGPLAAVLFGNAGDNRENLVHAYMWAMLAAEYLESQRYKATRYVIKGYLKEDELVTANKLIERYKTNWKTKEDCL